MTFISLEFAVFFATFFVIYWIVLKEDFKKQNILILIASYIFYGWWDWRFLSLILISSLVDYSIGIKLDQTEAPTKRKYLLWISIFTNLGILGYFKYSNFFIESFNDLFGIVGTDIRWQTLNIILPVGISFYTLQTLSYTIDIYDRKLKPTKKIINFFSFVSFFPQLVAGPIEKASNLLPQFNRKRNFDYNEASDGFRQILWGLFKKMVVADNCALFVTPIINNPENYNSGTLCITVIFGCMRLYCDFSGYTDIALGTARIFGFKLMKNFDFPYFSRNLSEFWNKWHISLITWLKDYVFAKLPRGNKRVLAFNFILIFMISGLWHGAQWKYIIWGTLHGIFLVGLLLFKRKKYRHGVAHNKLLPSAREFFDMQKTFWLFGILGIYFVCPTATVATEYIIQLFNPTEWGIPVLPKRVITISVLFLLGVEWLQRTREHGLELKHFNFSTPFRWSIYIILVFVIVSFGADTSDFIYFQF